MFLIDPNIKKNTIVKNKMTTSPVSILHLTSILQVDGKAPLKCEVPPTVGAIVQKALQPHQLQSSKKKSIELKHSSNLSIWKKSASTLFEGLTEKIIQEICSLALIDYHIDERFRISEVKVAHCCLIYQRLLSLYLKQHPDKSASWGPIQQHLDDIQKNLRTSPQYWEKRLKDLKEEESLTLHCGWWSPPAGHAQILRLQRKANDTITAYLYDSGGDQKHQTHYLENHNLRIHPVCKFQNIPLKDISRRSSSGAPGFMDILAGLLEPGFEPDKQPDDVMLRLLGPFQKYRAPDKDLDALPLTRAQRGPSCLWNAFDSLAVVELKDPSCEEYHHFKGFVRYTLTTAFYAQVFSSHAEGETIELLYSMTEALGSSSSKRSNPSYPFPLPLGEAQKRYVSCQAIKGSLDEWQLEKQKALQVTPHSLHLPQLDPKGKVSLGQRLSELKPARSLPPQIYDTTSIINGEWFHNPTRNELKLKWLVNLKNAYKKLKESGNGDCAERLLIHAVSQLPLPGPDMEKLLSHSKTSTLQFLSKWLSKLHLDIATQHPKGVSAHSSLAICSEHILGLIHQMALKIDEEKSKDYPVGHPLLKDFGLYRQNPEHHHTFLNQSPSPEDATRLKALEDYFSSINTTHNLLCAFPATMALSDKNKKSSGDANYYQKLLRSREELKKALNKHMSTPELYPKQFSEVVVSEETRQVAELMTDMGTPTEIDATWQPNLLNETLPHLVSLKRSALANHILKGSTEPFHSEQQTPFPPQKIQWFTYTWPKITPDSIRFILGIEEERSWSPETSQPQPGKERFLGYVIDDPKVQAFLKAHTDERGCFIQGKHQELSENALLKALDEEDSTTPALRSLLQAMTGKVLRPQHLLRHFAEELQNKLHEPLVQFLYQLYMYSPSSPSEAATPLQACAHESSFLRPFSDWVQKTLQRYEDLSNTHPSHLDACLFAMRQLQEVSTITRSHKISPLSPHEEISYYQRWLQKKHWSDEERALIHLHRAGSIASHTVAPNDDQALYTLLESWMHFKQTPVDPKRIPKELLQRIHDCLCSFSVTDMLSQLSPDSPLLLSLLSSLKLPQKGWQLDTEDPFLLTQESDDETSWGLHLLSGIMYTPEGQASISSHCPYAANPHFKRLFSTRNTNFTLAGSLESPVIRFTDALLGPCQILKEANFLHIERLSSNGTLRYLIPNNFILEKLPRSLRCNYSHWITTKGPSYSVEFRDLKTGALTYVLDSTGHLTKSAAKEIFVPLVSASSLQLEHFEEKEFIEVWEDAKGLRLVFPRLHLPDTKDPLALRCRMDGYQWKALPTHRIPLEQPQGLLGRLPNYLYLEGPSPKLLLPVRKVSKKTPFSPELNLQLKNTDVPQAMKLDFEEYQRMSRLVLIFDIKGDQVCARDNSGQAYLAYLALCQRNYGEAFEHLKTLDRKPPSTIIQELLHWIILQGRDNMDKAPTAAAVRLLAAESLLYYEGSPGQSLLTQLNEKEREDFFEAIHCDIAKYHSAERHVQQSCQLQRFSRRGKQNTLESLEASLARLEQAPPLANDASSWQVLTAADTPFPYPYYYPFGWLRRAWEPRAQNSKTAPIELVELDLKCLGITVGTPPKSPSLQQLLSNKPEQWLGECFQSLVAQARSKSRDERKRLEQYLWSVGAALQKQGIKNHPETLILYRILIDIFLYPSDYQDIQDLQDYVSPRKRHRFVFSLFQRYQEKQRERLYTLTEAKTLMKEVPRSSPLSGNKLKSADIEDKPALSQSLPLVVRDTEEAHFGRELFTQLSSANETAFPILRFPPDELKGLNPEQVADIKEIEEEAASGREKLLCQPYYSLAKGADLTKSLKLLSEDLKERRRGQKETERALSALLSPHNADPDENIASLLSASAKNTEPLPQRRLRKLFLMKDPTAYRTANPRLSDEECQLVDLLLTRSLMETTAIQHLERVQKALKRLRSASPGSSSYEELLQSTAQLIYSERTYDPDKSRACLIFEAIDNKRIRPDQAILIKKIEANPLQKGCFELAMAGGKTSVLAKVWALLVSAAGGTPIIVVPEAQLNAVRSHLKNSQRNCADQEVIDLHARANTLSDKRLKELSEEFDRAAHEGHLLLSTPEDPVHLELDALRLMHTLSQKEKELQVSKKDLIRLGQAQRIVARLRHRTCFFVDEMSFALNAHKETHFPVGDSYPMPMSEVELVRSFFQILTSPALRKIVRLQENKQSEMTADEWASFVRQSLAKQLTQYPLFDLKTQEQKESFCRFLLGKIPAHVERHAEDPSHEPLSPQEICDKTQRFIEGRLNTSSPSIKQRFCHYVRSQMSPALRESLIAYVNAHQEQKLLSSWPFNPSQAPQPVDIKALAKQVKLSPFELRSFSHELRQELMLWTLPAYIPKDRADSDSEDLSFLCKLKTLHTSPYPVRREIPELIALSRVMLNAVLVSVLGKRVRKHFGNARDGIPGHVSHYNAKEEPAKTDFGMPLEGAAAYFLNALVEGIAIEEVEYIAAAMDKAAHSFMDSNGEQYSDTAEAREFAALFELPLHAAGQREALKAATQTLNDSVELLLAFQCNMITHRVMCYDNYLSSNPARFVYQGASVYGGSGTMDNVATFDRELAQTFQADTTNKGRLLYTLWSHAEKGESIVLALDSTEPALLIEKIRDHGYSFFVDSGGRLDDANGLARAILSAFPKRFQAVAYYQPSQEGKESCLSLLLAATEPPILLSGTREEDISAYIPCDQIFFIVDEEHSYATDLPFSDDARGLNFGDPQSLMAKMLQGAARSRKIYQKQRVDFAILEGSCQHFFCSGQHFRHLLATAKFQSRKAQTKQLRQSFRQRLSNTAQQFSLHQHIFFEHPVDLKLSKIGKGTLNKYKMIGSVLLSRRYQNWWKRFSFRRRDRQESDVLFELAKENLYQIPWKRFSPVQCSHVCNAMENILQEAESHLFLQGEDNEDPDFQLGTEMEVGHEVEQDLAQQTELSLELSREWTLAQGDNGLSPSKARPMTKPPKDLDSYYMRSSSQIQTLVKFLKRGNYQNSYDELFGSNIHILKSLTAPFDEPISVFSLHFGECSAVLVYLKESGTYEFLAISKSDADSLAQYRFQVSDPWLISPSGQSLVPNHPRGPIPHLTHLHEQSYFKTQEIKNLLIQIALFNGDATYLAKHSKDVLALYGNTPERLALFRRYLRLQVEKDVEQKACYFRCPLFTAEDPSHQRNQLLHRQRHLKELKHKRAECPEDLSQTPPHMVRSLAPYQVPLLNDRERFLGGQLQFLVGNKTLCKEVSMEQITWSRGTEHHAKVVQSLSASRLNSISLTKEDLALLTTRQVAALRTPSLIGLLPPERLQEICPLMSSHVPYHLRKHLGSEEWFLENVDNFMGLTPRQLAAIDNPKWIAKFCSDQVRYMAAELVEEINSEDVICNLHPQQVVHLDPIFYCFLTEDQWHHFPKEAVHKLNSSTLSQPINDYLPKELFKYFRSWQLPLVNNSNIPYLGTRLEILNVLDSFCYASKKQIRALRSYELIARVPDERLHEIHPKASPFVAVQRRHLLGDFPWFLEHVDNFSGLKHEQLRNIENPEWIDKFLPDQREYMSQTLRAHSSVSMHKQALLTQKVRAEYLPQNSLSRPPSLVGDFSVYTSSSQLPKLTTETHLVSFTALKTPQNRPSSPPKKRFTLFE